MLTSEQLSIMKRVAQDNDIPFAALRAFCEVEAGNQIFTVINGKNMPLIRWEGHYFDRLVKAVNRAVARAQKLASPKVGGIKNPKSQADRYALLARAKKLDFDAAIMSTSYGFGQVMGEHWRSFGMSSAAAFEQMAFSGFEGQLRLVVLFLVKNNIVRFLRLKDWAAVARLYNGPRYAVNQYDIKLAKAYAKYANDNVRAPENVVVPSVGMLRPGSRGPEVRELQTLLSRAGYQLKIDGDFGGTTRDRVVAFQRDNKLPVDGIAGPATMELLVAYRASADEKLAVAPLMSTPEVKDSAAPIVGSVGVVALKDQLAMLAEQLTGMNVEAATTLAGYIQTGATVVGIGLTVYAFYGWWKSRKTVRGIEDRLPELKAT